MSADGGGIPEGVLVVKADLPTASEETEQINFFRWIDYSKRRFPELELCFHIPNGGSRSKAEAGRFRAAGVRAGVPDLFLPVPRGRFHGLWIELKAGKNKPTKEQLRWLSRLTEQGYMCAVCWGWSAAAKTAEGYLRMRT